MAAISTTSGTWNHAAMIPAMVPRRLRPNIAASHARPPGACARCPACGYRIRRAPWPLGPGVATGTDAATVATGTDPVDVDGMITDGDAGPTGTGPDGGAWTGIGGKVSST